MRTSWGFQSSHSWEVRDDFCSLPLYVSQSLILGLAGGVGPLGGRGRAIRGLKPLQCVVRKERRLLQAYVLRKEQKGLRTDQFHPRRKQGKGGPRDLWLS